MATARLYTYNGKQHAELKGQAQVVMDALKARNGEPVLAAELAKQIEQAGTLKTRQDVLRVTLYYIIVFKGKGLIATCEQERVEQPEPVLEGAASE